MRPWHGKLRWFNNWSLLSKIMFLILRFNNHSAKLRRWIGAHLKSNNYSNARVSKVAYSFKIVEVRFNWNLKVSGENPEGKREGGILSFVAIYNSQVILFRFNHVTVYDASYYALSEGTDRFGRRPECAYTRATSIRASMRTRCNAAELLSCLIRS